MPFIDSASTEAVVLITGGSAGAGRKIARELAGCSDDEEEDVED
jgi:NAD(P)-dependent dehydrogenase (short-subunit alcohol dehydrogenase family)